MPCYHPLSAYHLVDDQGRREGVSFKAAPGAHELTLPCGRCIGCRIGKADQWTSRVMHEAQLHEQNSFLTLTYDEEHVPENHGLRYSDFQLFMKRLRKKVGPVRFYMCGEYGDLNKRPHYHAAIFGHQFEDAVPFFKSQSGSIVYTSESLTKLWPLGHASIGELTRDSAAYIARYVIKKISGPPAETHYQRVDPDTGEIHQVEPEFTRMSLKPGIGARWIEQYHSDVYHLDSINTQGRLSKVPKYYDSQMEKINPDTLVTVRANRYKRAISQSEDNTEARLKTKQKLALAKNKLLKRTI